MSAPVIKVDDIKNAIRDFQTSVDAAIDTSGLNDEAKAALKTLTKSIFILIASFAGSVLSRFTESFMTKIIPYLQKIVNECGKNGVILIIPPELIKLGVQQYRIEGAGEKKRAKKPTKKPAKKVAKKPTKKVAKTPTKKVAKKTSKK